MEMTFDKWKEEVFRLGHIVNLDIEAIIDEQVLLIHYPNRPIKTVSACVEMLIRWNEINNNPEPV